MNKIPGTGNGPVPTGRVQAEAAPVGGEVIEGALNYSAASRPALSCA